MDKQHRDTADGMNSHQGYNESRAEDTADTSSQRTRFNRRQILQTLGAAVPAIGYSSQATVAQSLTASEATGSDGIDVTLIEADETSGFNFPYYLYAPPNTREKPMLVEPVNSGGCDDNFQVDLDAAESTARSGQVRTVSDELGVPLIVPVFANPCEGEFWNRFIQSLDTETMQVESGEFERIDEQLLRMIEDAQDRLAEHGISVPSEVMLNGFSASGNFVNNFTVLHPDRVASVSAGAINGMATLPQEEYDNRTLDYQIGVADVDELTGEPFDKDAWQEVPQLCYMGETEQSPIDDTLPYRDVWSEEQADQAEAVYGEDMQTDRMTLSEVLYHDADASSRFEVYDGVGHSYSPKIVNDIISFHRRHNEITSGSFIDGPNVSDNKIVVDLYATADGTTDVLEVRAFTDGRDITEDPSRIVSATPSRVTLTLTQELSLDQDVTVAVVSPEEPTLPSAVFTLEATATATVDPESVPDPGDTSISISYAYSTDFADSARLSIVPDGNGPFYERRIGLDWITPGEVGTTTFDLETDNQGVPFSEGDDIELWLVPTGNQVADRAVALSSFSIGSDEFEGTDEELNSSVCDASDKYDHEEVTVEFVERPLVGHEMIDVRTTVDQSFGQRARTRLFPETGGGTWGLDLDRVAASESGIQTYEVDEADLTLGETLTVVAFPNDWSRLEDAVASDCVVVSGVQFVTAPMPGDTEFTFEYVYPPEKNGDGRVTVSIDGEELETVTGIDPGTYNQHTISIDDTDGIPSQSDISVSLTAPSGDEIDSVTVTTAAAEVGTVSFAKSPTALTNRVVVDYTLDSDYDIDRFAMLRLYHSDSSSWGILLDRVDPGSEQTTEIEINLDEPGVPLELDEELTVALVNGDDPYAQSPLATARANVVSESEIDESDEEVLNHEDDEQSDHDEEQTDDQSEETDDGEADTEEVNGDSVTDTDETEPETQDPEVDQNGDAQPGFGVTSTVSAIGGLAYLVKRRLSRKD